MNETHLPPPHAPTPPHPHSREREREREQGKISQHSPNNHPHRPRRRRQHAQQILLHRQRSARSRRSNLCPISISISISIAVCSITASAIEVRSGSNRVRGIFPLGIDVGAARGHCGEEEGDAEDGEAHCCGCSFFGWLVNYCVLCVYVCMMMTHTNAVWRSWSQEEIVVG